MSALINIMEYPVKDVLHLLLQDKTTRKNIIWATDAYSSNGHEFSDKSQITKDVLIGINAIELQPRIEKAREEQQERTRKKAEVFTPVWLCNQMNNYCDEQWFGRKDVFNKEMEDHQWEVVEAPIEFPQKKHWKSYVDSRRLEITCGEAPYLVSRYDAATGDLILPPIRRIGILDRKLRIVNENTDTREEWLKWTIRAFQSCYGYEYQGDSLLIARINLLMTFCDYYEERWKMQADKKLLNKIANIISWNIWQMDGLKDTVPLGKPHEEYHQISMFEMLEETVPEETALPCKIKNWRANEPVIYKDLKRGYKKMGKKVFDFCIGNPPYQNDNTGESNTATPLYNSFMDAVFDVAQKTELITPARFLFNAGYTPKEWNKKMLNDPHFKVISYEPNSDIYFPSLSTPIKGGIAITYKDWDSNFGPIQIFSQYEKVNKILHRVINNTDFKSLRDIIVTSFAYHFTNEMYIDNPELNGRASKGHKYDIQSNAFSVFSELFFEDRQEGDYIRLLGRSGNNRCWRFIKRRYVTSVINLDSYKVFYAKATGSGLFGETLPEAIIGTPGDGGTVTFMSIGNFATLLEAENCVKYTKTKFARTLLSVLKVTQDNTPGKWEYVPLQDFTPSSDIDWSKSIHEIDLQLYRKYGLSEDEIAFIEENVKEMA